MSHAMHQLEVTENEAGWRLDKCLATLAPDLSRTRIQALLEQGMVTTPDGKVIRDAKQRVKPGETYHVQVPEATQSTIEAVDIPLDIVFEDAHILILNKPAGMTVHPAPGHHDDTLVNALLAHCGSELSGIGGVARPGIVHRIDKDTSGLLVVAKHDIAHRKLSKQLENRTLSRHYHALVWGVPNPRQGSYEGDIGRSRYNRQKMAVVKQGGKPALTHYQVREAYYVPQKPTHRDPDPAPEPVAAWVECALETGRTHQIRVHFTHHHHPLVGDPIYGNLSGTRLKSAKLKHLPEETREALSAFPRQALHAAELMLIHPETGEEMHFEAPLPNDMEDLIAALQHLQ